MSARPQRAAFESRRAPARRPIYVHRYVAATGAPPLPRDLLFPCMITLDGKLPAHLARFRYIAERLN